MLAIIPKNANGWLPAGRQLAAKAPDTARRAHSRQCIGREGQIQVKERRHNVEKDFCDFRRQYCAVAIAGSSNRRWRK